VEPNIILEGKIDQGLEKDVNLGYHGVDDIGRCDAQLLELDFGEAKPLCRETNDLGEDSHLQGVFGMLKYSLVPIHLSKEINFHLFLQVLYRLGHKKFKLQLINESEDII